MAYTKQNFVDDKTLYASQLNHIEDGIVTLENDVATRVSVNAQTLTAAQKKQARTNIGVDEPGTAASKVSEHNTSGSAHADIRSDIVAVAASSDIVCPVDGEVIAVADASDRELKGMKLYGKTIQNGTPTPDAPVPLETVGADGNVAVTVCGNNLWQFGDAVGAVGKNILLKTPMFLPAGQYVFSATAQKSESPNYWSLSFFDKDGTTITTLSLEEELIDATPIGFTLNRDCYKVSMYARSSAIYSNIQLERGSVATAYEPYNSQTLTAQTPNGLPGIPVSSGGNYIDENGQMWVCDEIDFARGKYVQRCKTVVYDGSDDEIYTFDNHRIWVATDAKPCDNHLLTDGYCNITTAISANDCFNAVSEGFSISASGNLMLYIIRRGTTQESAKAFFAEHPTRMVYILATPKDDIDLTAEEIAQYSALHTNKPNTTIYNDSGAGIEVDYVADTKLYIDKKFTELAAALVNN